MAKHEVLTTDAEIEAAIDAAIERAKLLPPEVVARKVEHHSRHRLLIVTLSNGRRLALPMEDVQGLGEATDEQVAHYELLGGGTGISFPEIDVDLYVPALIKGVYGNKRWMAELASKGGAAKTEAKRMASRANGAKGGRPRKSVQPELGSALVRQ